MQAKLLTTLSAITAFSLITSTIPAASFTEAKITRLEKDVKILKENAAPRTASVGDNVNAVSSVATGASSRAELKFPDNSLTRLGANSRFTIRGQGHTIDLDKGVLVFQVPEKLRDAKVRTAAVTAAVTGGTVIVELGPPLKVMCIEGTVDLYFNDDPTKFITLHAGQMTIKPDNATDFGPAVEFDLKLMLKTSKLLSGEGEPNAKEIADALKKQQGEIKDGDLVKTNLIIPGLGTVVQLDNDARFIVPQVPNKPGTPPPGATGGGGSTPPPLQPFQGVVPLIRGLTVINRNSFIKLDPQIKAFNLATNNILLSDGTVYRPAFDGPFPYFGFGSVKISDPQLQGRLAEKGNWVAYKFESLLINGTPDVGDFFPPVGPILFVNFNNNGPPPISNIILSAINDITLANRDALNDDNTDPGDADSYPALDLNNLDSVLLYSQNGSILLEEGFNIESNKNGGQDISLVAAGATSDITIEGDIAIYSARLLISAGRDLLVDGNVTADDIVFRGGRDVTINGTGGNSQYTVEAQKGNILVSAKRNIKITNSAQLKALSELSPEALLRLESLEGEITIDGDSTIRGTNIEIEALKGNVSIVDSTLTATHALKARTLRPDGTLLISGNSDRPTVLNAGLTSSANDLIRLYAEGGNGKVLFQGNVTLNSDEVQIAGKTVQVDPGGNVRVTQGNAHIFSDNHNYRINGAGSAPYGTIDVAPYGNVRQYNFNNSSKPNFKTGGKLGRGNTD